jgi:hypothetical protein
VSVAVLTPFVSGPAIELAGKKWEKKILPVGDVRYEGRMLHFTPQYLQQLAASYNDNAYDQVPFQLADAKNTHTNDPERTRGAFTAMHVKPDGLYGVLEPTDDGEKVLLNNPYLGVSARIVEGYERSDGKTYPAAIQHVLGTLDPRIPGLGPWKQVDMANAPATVIDLSAAEFAGKEDDMPFTPDQQAKLGKLLDLPDDQLDRLVQASATPAAPAAASGDLTEAEWDAMVASFTDEELADLLEEDTAPAGAGLANPETQMQIDLATAQQADQALQLAVLQGAHDKQAFENEKRHLMDAGVPPYLVELAKPLLFGSGHVIEMANGGSPIDAGAVMRKVLHETARLAQMLDLGIELGTSMDEPAGTSAATTQRDDLVKRAHDQMFGR